MFHDSPNQTRILAKLLREILAAKRFDSLGELTDALKARCVKESLLATDDVINGALTLIASNTPVVYAAQPVEHQVRRLQRADSRPIEHAEAAKILRTLGVSVTGGRLSPRVAQPNNEDARDDFPDLVPVPR